MSTEIVKPDAKVANVREFLKRLQPQLAIALPKHLTPDRMARIALTAMLKNPRLFDCDPASLAGSLLVAAQMGLEVDGREAHLVPFNNRKRGVIEKARELQLSVNAVIGDSSATRS